MYFLANGIYPAWLVFAKKISLPGSENDNKYAKHHEHVCKDIERCFGVLMQKYGILQHPLRGWLIEDICSIINCCIILHNMTIESHRVNFTFNNLVSNLEDEPSNNATETIFMDENAEIEIGYTELFGARIAFMSSSVEDQD